VNVVTDCTVNPLKGESLDKISTTLAIQTHGNEPIVSYSDECILCVFKKRVKGHSERKGEIMTTLMTFGWYSAYDS